MKRLYFFCVLIFFSVKSFSQTATCAQTLRLARATYEQGRLHEIESQLKGCLETGFTKDEKQLKVEGYKLLCLSYIYLEEPEKADEAMLNILKADHDFQINPAIDPAEFIGLYNTFRSKPLFSFGLFVGPNASFPTVTENFAISSSAAGLGKYSTKVSVQIGLAFEKHLAGKFTAAPELSLSNRAFSYSNPKLFTYDSSQNSSARGTGDIKQSWLDLNLLVQYKVGKRALNSYVSFGPNIGLLLNTTNALETKFTTGTVTSGPPIDFKSNHKSLGFSLIGAAGIKYKFGAVYITANVRYQFGLSKVIDVDKKSNPVATFDNLYSSNVYSQQNTAVLVGFIFPFFNPKKLNVPKKSTK